MGIDPASLEAYLLDSAVSTFGNAFTAALEAVEGKNAAEIENKRKKTINRWFPESEIERFRDPAKG
jgi:hypothetical protein